MKIKLIFVLYSLGIGGTTSALLALLRSLNYSRYSVDLLLLYYSDEYTHLVPPDVRILKIWPYHSHKRTIISRIERKVQLAIEYVRSGYIQIGLAYYFNKKLKKNTIGLYQCFALRRAKHMRQVPYRYNVAISFMEMWPSAYTAFKVLAKSKIAWLHVDYIGANLKADVDQQIYQYFNSIVTVSEQCLNSFQRTFPEFANKTYCLENLVSESLIKDLAKVLAPEIDQNCSALKIITVCRLDNRHKGLDRAVTACRILHEKGVDVCWFVVGDGPDREKLRAQIRQENVDDRFILLGARQNPFPYIKKADLFALPSRYEGKPIVVTESQILGCPVIVTNYASAKSQINNGYDGIVLENSDEGFVNGIVDVCTKPALLKKLRNNLKGFKVDNEKSLQAFYKLIEGAC